MITPTQSPWFFDDLIADDRAHTLVWREISEDDYYYALGAVPPIYGPSGGFLMGEAFDQSSAGTVYAGFYVCDDRYFARLIAQSLFAQAVADLRAELDYQRRCAEALAIGY